MNCRAVDVEQNELGYNSRKNILKNTIGKVSTMPNFVLLHSFVFLSNQLPDFLLFLFILFYKSYAIHRNIAQMFRFIWFKREIKFKKKNEHGVQLIVAS